MLADSHPTHALLGASSSNRWSNCPGSARFEELFPNEETSYAAEGTLAHHICELTARHHICGNLSDADYDAALHEAESDPLYDPEMLECAEGYCAEIIAQMSRLKSQYGADPVVELERRVEFDTYVPEGYGTADCVIIGGPEIVVIDYKHGKGVEVSATDNSQLRLYAIGAMALYPLVPFRTVTYCIYQPRVSSLLKQESMGAYELLEWGEALRQKATDAYLGIGEFRPGEWCKWCKGAGDCRERAEKFCELEPLTHECHPNALSDDEIADLLPRLAGLEEWAKAVRAYATKLILAGGTVRGYKVVAGRANRAFADGGGDKAIAALTAAGWNEALFYDRRPKTLAQIEKVVGKKDFAELCGEYVTRPEGKPTLVREDNDKDSLTNNASEFVGL